MFAIAKYKDDRNPITRQYDMMKYKYIYIKHTYKHTYIHIIPFIGNVVGIRTIKTFETKTKLIAEAKKNKSNNEKFFFDCTENVLGI